MNERFDVAIVGGGVSGSALTIALAASAPPSFRVAVFEPNDLGPGVAYAPQSASLLLNGPVRAMSPVVGDDEHFQRYLVDERPEALVCRSRYGAYLRSTVARAMAARPSFVHVESRVASIVRDASGFVLRDLHGRAFTATCVVLALGNFAPDSAVVPGPLRTFANFHRNPWSDDIGRFSAGPVLIVGTRLTALDAVALLDERAHAGQITLLSRHGLVPHVEDTSACGVEIATLELDTSSPSALFKTIRRAHRRNPQLDWRVIIESLRAPSPAIWKSWGYRERRRFLRHLAHYWAMHRYRVPAATYGIYERLLRENRLRVIKGRIKDASIADGVATMTVQSRGDTMQLVAHHVINATGPAANIRRVDDPLIEQLLDARAIVPDPLHLGIDVDEMLRVRDADARATQNFYAMGPLVRGLSYETTAVPEIREHAATLAAQILT